MVIELYKWCLLPIFSIGMFMGGKETAKSAVVNVKNLHPLHLATVEIEHNATDKTIEITCKTFWDDFQNILGKINKTTVDLSNDKDRENKNKWIFNYIKSNLQITIDGKLVSLSFVGFEQEDQVVFSYLEVSNIPSIKNVSITNTLMHDLFDDQVEIIHVIVNGKRQSTKLEFPRKEASFSW
jgi:hypothetical protein